MRELIKLASVNRRTFQSDMVGDLPFVAVRQPDGTAASRKEAYQALDELDVSDIATFGLGPSTLRDMMHPCGSRRALLMSVLE